MPGLHAVYADICSGLCVELDTYGAKDFEACNICTYPSAKQGPSTCSKEVFYFTSGAYGYLLARASSV
jgi:hypothetical protein